MFEVNVIWINAKVDNCCIQITQTVAYNCQLVSTTFQFDNRHWQKLTKRAMKLLQLLHSIIHSASNLKFEFEIRIWNFTHATF